MPGIGHPAVMRIRYWGTRGSIATPGPSTVRYGGNTSCVELRSDSRDAGRVRLRHGSPSAWSSARRADTTGGDPVTGSILLGHTHWDHIQGLPFFEPLFGGGHWDVYGPRGLGVSLDQTLAGQMNYQYFPVALDQLGAEVAYHELVEGTFEIGDLVVRTQYFNHPALTLGYRVECDGASVCYITDHEPFDPALGSGGDVSANRRRRPARRVLGGRRRPHPRRPVRRFGVRRPRRWGHSRMEYVVDVASAAGVRRTVLFHHDPSHDDAAIDALVARANTGRRAGRRSSPPPRATCWRCPPARRRGTARSARPRRRRRPWRSCTVSIVIITGDRALRPWSRMRPAPSSSCRRRLRCVGPVDRGRRRDRRRGRRRRGRRTRSAAIGHRPVRVVVGGSSRSPGAHRCASRSRRYFRLAGLAGNRGARANEAARGGPPPGVPPARRAAAARRGDAPRRAHALGPARHRRRGALRPVHRASRERFGVPIALITFVDRDRQWFKSRRGFDEAESPRTSRCARTPSSDPTSCRSPTSSTTPASPTTRRRRPAASASTPARRSSSTRQSGRHAVHRRPPAPAARRRGARRAPPPRRPGRHRVEAPITQLGHTAQDRSCPTPSWSSARDSPNGAARGRPQSDRHVRGDHGRRDRRAVLRGPWQCTEDIAVDDLARGEGIWAGIEAEAGLSHRSIKPDRRNTRGGISVDVY